MKKDLFRSRGVLGLLAACVLLLACVCLSPAPAEAADRGGQCGCLSGGPCVCVNCKCRSVSPAVQRYTVSAVESPQPAAPASPDELTFSVKQSPSGSFVAVSNFTDHKGRRVIRHSDDREGKALKRHTKKGLKLGLE